MQRYLGAGLGPNSTFLDIGSGYGKPTFHVYIATGARSTGIEYVPRRVQESIKVQKKLQAYIPGIKDGVHFEQGDIMSYKKLDYDFIYFYDRLAKVPLISALEKILIKSTWTLFVSYQPPRYYSKLIFIDSMRVRTTGKQCFTAYFYKHPRLADQ